MIFDLLKDKGQGTGAERLAKPYIINLKERTALVFHIQQPKRHVVVIWRIKRILRSFSNPSCWDRNIANFARDIVGRTLPPTFLVEY